MRTCFSCSSGNPCSTNLITVSAHMKRPAARAVKGSRNVPPGQPSQYGAPISSQGGSKKLRMSRVVSILTSAPVGSSICLQQERNDKGTRSSRPVTMSLNFDGRCDQCTKVSSRAFRCPAWEGSDPHSSKPSRTITGISWSKDWLCLLVKGSIIRDLKCEAISGLPGSTVPLLSTAANIEAKESSYLARSCVIVRHTAAGSLNVIFPRLKAKLEPIRPRFVN